MASAGAARGAAARSLGVGGEVGGDALGLEAALGAGGGGVVGGADGGLVGLLDGLEDGLRAPGEAVDLLDAARGGAGAGVVLVEGVVDAAEDGFEGNAGLAPGLDQRPVEGGEHEQGAAALLEALLDLGEVVDVVLNGYPLPPYCPGGSRFLCCGCAVLAEPKSSF